MKKLAKKEKETIRQNRKSDEDQRTGILKTPKEKKNENN